MAFVYDGETLPAGKSDLAPSTVPVDKKITAAEYNALIAAVTDLRTAILSGQYHGLVSTPSAPVSAAGALRLRDNAGVLEQSVSGAAYAPVTPDTSAGVRGFVPAAGLPVSRLAAGTAAGQVVTYNGTAWEARAGVIDVRDYGTIDVTGAVDCAPAINAALQAHRTGAARGIVTLPAGRLRLSSSIITESMVTLRGEGRGNTILAPDAGVTAIVVAKGSLAPHGGSSDFAMIGAFEIDGPEAYLQWDGAAANGITLASNGVLLHDIYIHDMQTHALEITSSPSGTNANCFQVRNLLVYYCGGDGLYIHGGDANAGATYDCSVTGCGGSGFHDVSFLGNLHVRPHTEANITYAYHFVGDLNMGLIVGGYSESDQVSSICPATRVDGGDHGAPISGGAIVEGINGRTRLQLIGNLLAGVAANASGLRSELALAFADSGEAGGAGYTATRGNDMSFGSTDAPGFLELAYLYAYPSTATGIAFAQRRAIYRDALRPAARAISPGRALVPVGVGALATDDSSDVIAGLHLGSGKITAVGIDQPTYTTAAGVPIVGNWCAGDVVLYTAGGTNRATALGTPLGYVCTSPGTFGTYSEGRTATVAAGVRAAVLDAVSAVLVPGKWVTINGHSFQILPQREWSSGVTYQNTVYEYVLRRNGTNVYRLTGNGVSGATGPTGTGTGITDGTCTWDYVGPANTTLCFDNLADTMPASGTFAITFPTPTFAPIAPVGQDVGTDSSGTPGAATINKLCGISAINTGDSSVVVTNSLVTAGSHVLITPHARDATCKELIAVPAAGSFTVSGSAAATAPVPFSWRVCTLR